ncbi:MAG TPA: AfsR/SARP family transcriptional regulator, partial [Microlunatus sp.]
LTATVLALWRGEPYAGVADTGWLGPARQQLADARLELAELRLQALLEVGRPEEAIGDLGPLLVEHPFRERLWARRMLALYQAGRQSDALTAFAEVRDLLADELGVDPSPSVQEMYGRLLT